MVKLREPLKESSSSDTRDRARLVERRAAEVKTLLLGQVGEVDDSKIPGVRVSFSHHDHSLAGRLCFPIVNREGEGRTRRGMGGRSSMVLLHWDKAICAVTPSVLTACCEVVFSSGYFSYRGRTG